VIKKDTQLAKEEPERYFVQMRGLACARRKGEYECGRSGRSDDGKPGKKRDNGVLSRLSGFDVKLKGREKFRNRLGGVGSLRKEIDIC
jgi:hypothetical protein